MDPKVSVIMKFQVFELDQYIILHYYLKNLG